MRIDAKFLARVGMAVGVVGALAAYPLWMSGSREVVVAALAGCVVSVLNALAGSLTIEYAFDKPPGTFLKAVLGGMGLRMAFLLGAFFVMIKVVQLHTVALSVSLLGFYIIFLFLEILSMQKKFGMRDQQSTT